MKPLIVANWKMNPLNFKQSFQLAEASDEKNVILCPPFVFLSEIKKNIRKAEIGAQDCFWEKEGSFTGEISPLMLQKMGCRYVIIGHSERRNYLKETDEVVNRKIRAVLRESMKPILCIGEKKEKTKQILRQQINGALKNIPKKNLSKLIVAYEPIWAIGTGRACGFKEAEKTRIFIEKLLKEKYSFKKPIILYGGSVNSRNYLDYITKACFDGLLIGGASLKPGEIKKILKF